MSGCDTLFRHFFVPWYRLPPGVAAPRIVKGDIELYSEAAGQCAADAWQVPQDQQRRLAEQVAEMVAAARADWPTYLEVDDVVSFEAVDAFDSHWTRPRVAEVIRSSDAFDFANEYLVLCCELGAVALAERRSVQADDGADSCRHMVTSSSAAGLGEELSAKEPVVPAGGLALDGSQWIPTSGRFFLPVKALRTRADSESLTELQYRGNVHAWRSPSRA